MRVEITLCVYESHSWVQRSHYACINYSCACWNHSLECRNHICACQSHNSCGNYTLRVQISVDRVAITLLSVIFTGIMSNALSCVQKAHSACKMTLCVWKSYCACRNQSCACWIHTPACLNHPLQVEITLCMQKSFFCVLKSLFCVLLLLTYYLNPLRTISMWTIDMSRSIQ
jgi:hypothetical protein